MGLFEKDLACIAQREFVNIPAWQQYSGKGLCIFCDDIEENHVSKIADIIQTILPEATIYTGWIEFTKDDRYITGCHINCLETGERLPFDEFILKYQVKLINNSTTGGGGEVIQPESEFTAYKMINYHLIFCGAAGNVSRGAMSSRFYGSAIMVSSVDLVRGEAVYGNRSIGDIDFVMFHGWDSGTSFSSPFMLAMIGLIISRYGDMFQVEVYQYLQMISLDLGDPGYDSYFGNGIPILPDLNRRYLSLVIGSRDMRVDGRTVVLEAAPTIAKRRTAYVPLSVFSLGLGAQVSWDADHTVVRISKGKFEISLSVGGSGASAGRSGAAEFGRSGTPILRAILNKEGLPLVPVRAVAEALNCKVDFVKVEKRVMILAGSTELVR